jgi:hypothetical protein
VHKSPNLDTGKKSRAILTLPTRISHSLHLYLVKQGEFIVFDIFSPKMSQNTIILSCHFNSLQGWKGGASEDVSIKGQMGTQKFACNVKTGMPTRP